MTITVFGTDWCEDTRRTRALLARKGIRPKFIDIEARPDQASHILDGDGTVRIPVIEFADGSQVVEPDLAELERVLADRGLLGTVRHRTRLDREQRRFEQYRNDELVASADYIERGTTIVIVALDRHGSQDANRSNADVERLTTGVLRIAEQANRPVDIDLGAAASTPAEPQPAEPAAPTETVTPPAAAAPETAPPAAAAPATAAPTSDEGSELDEQSCALTPVFSELWADGAGHRDAVDFAKRENVGPLAVIKGLHALWEMPLTPEAMALAFGETDAEGLAASFHVLGWIIEQNPTSTMSEFQAFDDLTGVSRKTRALSLARRPRDTIALVDRMGPGLTLRSIDEQHARQLAANAINEEQGLLRIQDRSTLRHSFGWVFLYQSVEYLETGDYSTMISGNAPLLVDRFTGALWVTGTEERPAVYIENYEATGDPHRQPTPSHARAHDPAPQAEIDQPEDHSPVN